MSLKLFADESYLSRNTFTQWVDQQGNITLPTNYRQKWRHLGSWIVEDAKAPGHGFHDVYTQDDAVLAFNKTHKFADGTVIVKEVRSIHKGIKTKGKVQWAGDIQIWFVMIKDTKERFKDNPHWAHGWGWALFESKAFHADKITKNISQGFVQSCQGCHLPARHHDWVFVEGYPTLETPPSQP